MAKAKKAQRDVIPPTFTYAEMSTVLAALRLFQAVQESWRKPDTDSVNPLEVHYGAFTVSNDGQRARLTTTGLAKMEHFEDVLPLSPEGIETLCQRLNTTSDIKLIAETTKAIRNLRKAADGDSNDAEIEAASDLAEAAEKLVEIITRKCTRDYEVG